MARRGPSPLILLGGLAAILTLVTGALFLLDDGRGDPDDPSGTAPDLGNVTVKAPPALDLPVYDGRQPPLEPPEPDLDPATLTGRIIDNQHLPIRMGTVEVVVGEAGVLGGILRRQKLDVAPVDIDERGGFRIEGLPVRDDLLLQIRGDAFVATVAGPFNPLPGETLDLGELLVDRGVSLTGTVYDTQGAGIPGARVMLGYGMGAEQFLDGSGAAPERITEADGGGGYEFRHVNRASHLITAGAPGFASRTVRGGTPMPGSPSLVDFDIVLSAARALHGTVFAKDTDSPLPGVRITARSKGQYASNSSTTSDSNGRFQLPSLAAARYALISEKKGYQMTELELDLRTTATQEVDVHMNKAAGIRGRVVTPAGAAVTSFEVRPRRSKNKNGASRPEGPAVQVRNKQGSFELVSLQPGWYRIEVWAKGYALTTTEIFRVRPGKQTAGIEVTMQAGAALTGVVLNEQNQPLQGAEVSLHLNNIVNYEIGLFTPTQEAWQARTRTNAEGRFLLPDLVARDYQMRIEHPSFPQVTRNDVLAVQGVETDLGDLVLPTPGSIVGVVVDRSGQVVRRAQVYCGLQVTHTDGEGRFRFDKLLPAEYLLEARRDGPADPTTQLDITGIVQQFRAREMVKLSSGEERSVTVVVL
jgi:protocatechuate 3,4-dioxygenase beta subunit